MAHKTIVGKNLIEMLMFNIYADNMVIYREYVQNASDSIHSAIEQGILSQEDAHISVNIDRYASKIIIEDNGTGISLQKAERLLKDIANSEKGLLENQAGYFGIGRLSGGGYCKKLKFETSFKGENKKSLLVFDVETIREIINDKNDLRDAATIIDDCTKFFDTMPEEAEQHYFKVILEDILPEYAPNILDEKKVSDYLKEVAPLAFSPSFKNILDNEIENSENSAVKPYYDNINTIKLTVNNITDNRKKYTKKVQIKSGKDDIEKIRYVLFHDDTFGDLAWGWVGITKFTEVIKEQEESAVIGLRLRLHNIMIGQKNYFDGTRFFKQARSNKYFIGEIHIISNKIKPTPQRDDLAPSTETNLLYEKIQLFFRNELEKIYQDANKLKKTIDNFNEKKISFEELETEYGRKKNNIYKNLLGYQYLLSVYKPEYDKIIEKYGQKQKSEQPSGVLTETVQTVEEQTISAQPEIVQQNTEQPEIVRHETVSVSQTELPLIKTSESVPETETNEDEDVDDFKILEKTIGKNKTEVVLEIFKILEKNFTKHASKKVQIGKTINNIKNTIIRELKKTK